jgi:hypothetical protein
MLKIVALLVASLALYGCAGSTPHPVPQYQPGDNQLSCGQIVQELNDNQSKILSLLPKQNKTGKNVALGVAGAIFLVPLFFMDFSDAERVEIDGYQLRDSWLRNLANQKHCGTLPAKVQFAH